MDMSLSHKVDTTIFNKSINTLRGEYPGILKKALEEVGLRVVVDAVSLEPKAPIYDGFLTGAFTVTVTGEEPIKPGNYPKGGETGKETKQTLDHDQVAPIDTSGMQPFEVRIGNSMKYAAGLHEFPFRPGFWSEKRGGVGYKFLSSKLLNYGDKYKELLAGFIRKRMAGRLYL
jgi:hypothetical protein